MDFEQLDSWKEKLKGDVLFSAMGTTLKTAGSKDAQYQIDYNYQHDVAQAASENGVASLLLVSSVGSSSKSPFFYPKIKGQLEDAVSQMNFKQVHIFSNLDIQVFPNPTSDFWKISTTDQSIQEIIIYDLMGNQLSALYAK